MDTVDRLITPVELQGEAGVVRGLTRMGNVLPGLLRISGVLPRLIEAAPRPMSDFDARFFANDRSFAWESR